MRVVSYLVAIMVGTLLLWVSSPPVWSKTSDRLPVAASILPLADFTRNVGGDRINLTVLVPAGSSPHIYEPTPARARAVSEARVLVLNGVGLEFWAEKLIRAADNRDLIVVWTAEGLDIIEGGEGVEAGASSGDRAAGSKRKGNPHVWLDPLNAIHQVERIRDGLIEADPEGAETYRANAERYIGKLRELDREIREAVSRFVSREFIGFHAAYRYFARRYGLRQVAVVERTPGREPSPREIAAIVKIAKRFKVRAILAEPQLPPGAARVIAEECDAEVLFFDPLGDPPHYAYLETMRRNVRDLARVLGGKP